MNAKSIIMKTAYLGVDVSKGYADFVLIDEDMQQLADPTQLDDTTKGYKKCEQWLRKSITKHGLTQIRAAVESTGGLENNWLASFKTMLSGFDLSMIRLNPATVKFASKATLSTVTTDEKSALNIAQYLVRYGRSLDFNAPENPYLPYKKVLMQLRYLTKINTGSKNIFRQLLYESFPELQAFCPKDVPNWLIELLKKYPTPSRLARAKPAVIAKIKGITVEKAEQLIMAAKNSAASAKDDSIGLVMDTQIRQIQYEKEQIKKLKLYLERNVKGPEIDLLTSITGIGTYSAAVLMILIGDCNRFPSPRKLASFFGVTPEIRQSGDKKGHSKMSKKGSSLARATLFMCAKSAAIHDEHMKRIYTNHITRGKNYYQTMGVIMHKLLRMCWGVLTSKTPYNPAIDQKNQQNPVSAELQKDQEWINKRKEQAFDPLAPVSNRARKQRKEHLLSQAVRDGHVRDLESAPLLVET